MVKLLQRLMLTADGRRNIWVVPLLLFAIAAQILRPDMFLDIVPRDQPLLNLQDFRDALYYSACAFLDGINAYDPQLYMSSYPVQQHFPLYAPLTMLVHTPFALLPFEAAKWVWLFFNIALLAAIVVFVLRIHRAETGWSNVLFITALVLLSRPGRMNAMLGQITLEMIFASLMTLHFARIRPWLSGLGLALAMMKPTYGIPLAVFLAARRDWAALGWGVGLTSALNLMLLPRLIHNAGGFVPLLDSIRADQAFFVGDADPLRAPDRVDIWQLVSLLNGSTPPEWLEHLLNIGALGLAAVLMARLRRHQSAAVGMPGIAATFLLLFCMYHQAYDNVILILPGIALLVMLRDGLIPRTAGYVLLACAILPFANYLSSDLFLHNFVNPSSTLGKAIMLSNPVIILVGVAVVWAGTLRINKDEAEDIGP